MYINSISSCPRVQSFGNRNDRVPDRAATVQELYEVEKNILDKIQKQNELLADAFKQTNNLIYYAPFYQATQALPDEDIYVDPRKPAAVSVANLKAGAQKRTTRMI